MRGLGFDEQSWDRWEQTGEAAVRAILGAVTAIEAMRSANVTVIFNTNRRTENAKASARTLEQAGFGRVEHRRTLWFMGDTDDGSRKDGGRTRIAESCCVIAMAGDQLGDFSDLFHLPAPQRRTAAQLPADNILMGQWLVRPLQPGLLITPSGTRDQKFAPDVRWRDMAG